MVSSHVNLIKNELTIVCRDRCLSIWLAIHSASSNCCEAGFDRRGSLSRTMKMEDRQRERETEREGKDERWREPSRCETDRER